MRILLTALLVALSGGAAAQLRTLPQNAQHGVMRHVESMAIEIDGKPQQLAPGAQIRDVDNRLVLPASLQEREQVLYLLDAAGRVYRVWMLSAPEKEALPRAPSPYPK